MTTPYRRKAICPNCYYDMPLEDEISSWIRNNEQLRSSDGFVFMDKDLICHRFKTTHGRSFQCLMFVEFKSRGRDLNESQRDTMHLINQMFRTDRTTPTKISKPHLANIPDEVYSIAARSKVKVKGFGYHLVRLSGTTPDDSNKIIWDKREISKDDLIKLLRFDLNPDTLQQMDWRVHHKKREEALLPL